MLWLVAVLPAPFGPRDAGAVAATREFGLARLVSTDRDFVTIPERRTPRKLLLDLKETPRPGGE